MLAFVGKCVLSHIGIYIHFLSVCVFPLFFFCLHKYPPTPPLYHSHGHIQWQSASGWKPCASIFCLRFASLTSLPCANAHTSIHTNCVMWRIWNIFNIYFCVQYRNLRYPVGKILKNWMQFETRNRKPKFKLRKKSFRKNSVLLPAFLFYAPVTHFFVIKKLVFFCNFWEIPINFNIALRIFGII